MHTNHALLLVINKLEQENADTEFSLVFPRGSEPVILVGQK